MAVLGLSFSRVHGCRCGALGNAMSKCKTVGTSKSRANCVVEGFIHGCTKRNHSSNSCRVPMVHLTSICLVCTRTTGRTCNPANSKKLTLSIIGQIQRHNGLPTLGPRGCISGLAFFCTVRRREVMRLFTRKRQFFSLHH